MKNLFLIVCMILLGAVSSNAHHKVSNTKSVLSKNKGADDTEALQALFDRGGVINLPAGRTYTTSGTVYLKSNSEIVNGNMCTIIYSGTDAAIGFQKVNGKNYPVRNVVSDLSIVLQGKGAVGIRWQCSYSNLRDCAVALKSNDQTGYELSGDVNGTGSYYNLFENCFVQGGKLAGTTNDYGWKFTYDKSAPSRCPNSNTWVGGRVGQCDVGMYINGGGNVVNHMTAEGCGIAFYFDNADSKVGCISNKVVMPYIEACKTGFKFGVNSLANAVNNPYMTGISSIKEDVGTKNTFNLNN